MKLHGTINKENLKALEYFLSANMDRSPQQLANTTF